MPTPNEAPKRKPARSAFVERCMCNHPAEDHGEDGCQLCGGECKTYRPRPCTCSHSAADHEAGKTKCSHCDCKRFRQDASPEFLLRMGIRAGDWQFVTIPQLKFLMRPGQDPTIRVWACGMLHTIGQRGRLAVTVNKKGAKVPLQPGHIADELNAMDPIGRMSRQSVRRELLELESQGAARQLGKKVKGGRLLYFYAKPLKQRAVAPEPEAVEEPAEADSETQIVVWPDYNPNGSHSEQSQLEHTIISRVRKTLSRTFLEALRTEIAANERQTEERIVVQPDYKKLVDEALAEIEIVVWSAYNRLRIVVWPDPPIKEDSSSSVVKSMQACTESSSDTPAEDACLPAEPDPPPTPQPEPPRLAALRKLFPSRHIADEKLNELDSRIGTAVGDPAYPPEAFIAFAEQAIRGREERVSTGLVFAERGLWHDFAEHWKAIAAQREAERQAAEAYQRRQAEEAEQWRLQVVAEYRHRLDEPATRDEALREVANWQLWDYLAELQPDLVRLGYTPPEDDPPKTMTAAGGGQ